MVITIFVINSLTDWPFYFVWIGALSVTTFILYGIDKGDATVYKGRGAPHRVPEKLLHLLTLLGGFPGALLGMIVFWHKVRKPIFLVVIIFSAMIQAAFVLMMNGSA